MNKKYVIGDIQIDEEYKYLLSKYKWYFKKEGHLKTKINGKFIYLHHFILNTNKLVDHIDRNPLNNKKSNLRLVTKSQNSMNSKLRIDNSSGIKGVSFCKIRHKFRVYITINKKRKFLGDFINIKEAALKRIEAEKEYFKEYANYDLIKQIEEKYG